MAMQIANKLEGEARLRREGFIDADMDAAKAAGAVPLANPRGGIRTHDPEIMSPLL